MTHTIEVPDSIWNWADAKRDREGTATYLRDMLIEEALKRQLTEPKPEPAAKGKAVHFKCYGEMVDAAPRGSVVPSGTELKANFQTPCHWHKCPRGRTIRPGTRHRHDQHGRVG